jgi:hypothetical protein
VVTLAMGEVVQNFDGTTAWMQMGPQPPAELPAAMVPEMRRGMLLAGGIGVLREAIAGRAEVAALEPKPVNGVTLDRISWKQGELEMVLGFDPKTHLLTNVTYRAMTVQGPADAEVRVGDHKPAANGLTVPMRVTTFNNGQQVLELVFSEWLFNTGVSPDTFKK